MLLLLLFLLFFINYIYLELLGKKEIWEQSMNRSSSILYQKSENYIELLKVAKLLKIINL